MGGIAHTTRFAAALILLFGITLPAAVGAAADEPPDVPNVVTIAGSGGLGIADGPAGRATFASPAAVAYGVDSTLYIADRDAQRIRALTKDGVVKTIAGSGPMVPLGIGVGGGYRDGAALQAQFNMPSAVLPLPDGSLIVADTKNYCLRLIKHGVVSTLTGRHTEQSGRDGTLATARYKGPRSLARDNAGNIYVADPPDGVRKIDPRGTVTTLSFGDSGAVLSVSTAIDEPNALFVATTTKIERIDLTTMRVDRTFLLESPYDGFSLREDLRPAGPAAAIAAFDANEFAWVDPLNSAVRFGQFSVDNTHGYTRVLTQVPTENASDGDAAYGDGAEGVARVDEPLGIAIAPNGSLVVADTGNRRIRLLGQFSHRTDVLADVTHTELPTEPDPREYRIALVGDSYVSFGQAWNESIAGFIEAQLRAAWPKDGRTPRVYPIMRSGVTSLGADNLIDELLSDGEVDAVVLDLASYGHEAGGNVAVTYFPPGWDTKLTQALSATYAKLEKGNIPFLVVEQPGAGDFPDELAFNHLPPGPRSPLNGTTAPQRDPVEIQYYQDLLDGAVLRAHVPTVNLWPAFMEAYAASNRLPLFHSWDHHLTTVGRRIVASTIAEAILASKPWTSAEGASR